MKITAGIILKPEEVKKFKEPGFTVKNYEIKNIKKGKLKLIKKNNKNYRRKLLIKKTESKIIKKLKYKKRKIELTNICIVKGLVKLNIRIIKVKVCKFKNKE